MWNCPKCGEPIEDQFDTCWKCGITKGNAPAAPSEDPASAEEVKPRWRLAYKYFRGTLATWEDLFDQAAW
jgi:uncharacterized membrane protein YvbJ